MPTMRLATSARRRPTLSIYFLARQWVVDNKSPYHSWRASAPHWGLGVIVCTLKFGGDSIVKMPYCSQCTIGENLTPSHAITSRQRLARAIAGIGCLSLALFFLRLQVPAIAWPLAIIAGWLGASHIVAGWIGYPDCLELGAIATLVSRRYIPTRCGPWVTVDRWLEPRSGV